MTSRWLSPRALGLHATVLVVVPACILLGRWQISRALGGNELSWAYAVEWPVFAAYGVYLWWKLIHETPSERRAEREKSEQLAALSGVPGVRPGTVLADRSIAQGETADWRLVDDEVDPELAAYNRYLAQLGTSDVDKRW